VGSVLDLFAGRPSLPKLRLWADDATFEDNITVSKGRKQYEAQWVRAVRPFARSSLPARVPHRSACPPDSKPC